MSKGTGSHRGRAGRTGRGCQRGEGRRDARMASRSVTWSLSHEAKRNGHAPWAAAAVHCVNLCGGERDKLVQT